MCVEVYPVQGTYTAWGGICEKSTMKKHNSCYKVEPEEHGYREEDIYGNVFRQEFTPRLHVARYGIGCCPREVEGPGDGVYGTHEELEAQLETPPPWDGDPPVLHAVVYRKQLQQKTSS